MSDDVTQRNKEREPYPPCGLPPKLTLKEAMERHWEQAGVLNYHRPNRFYTTKGGKHHTSGNGLFGAPVEIE